MSQQNQVPQPNNSQFIYTPDDVYDVYQGAVQTEDEQRDFQVAQYQEVPFVQQPQQDMNQMYHYPYEQQYIEQPRYIQHPMNQIHYPNGEYNVNEFNNPQVYYQMPMINLQNNLENRLRFQDTNQQQIFPQYSQQQYEYPQQNNERMIVPENVPYDYHQLNNQQTSQLENEEDEKMDFEKNILKNETQQMLTQTTRHTSKTTIEKYQKLSDNNKDDTKNILRNFMHKLKNTIRETQADQTKNRWVISILEKYALEKNIENVNEFITSFLEMYKNIKLSNFTEVRENWTVTKTDNDLHYKSALREVSFFFFSKMPLHYIYRESNKVNKKNQRFTHLKYLPVFLKGIIEPLTFQKFKQAPQKQKQMSINPNYTSY